MLSLGRAVGEAEFWVRAEVQLEQKGEEGSGHIGDFADGLLWISASVKGFRS